MWDTRLYICLQSSFIFKWEMLYYVVPATTGPKTEEGVSFLIMRVAANILNKQSRSAKMG
jgi:hypothetical protein